MRVIDRKFWPYRLAGSQGEGPGCAPVRRPRIGAWCWPVRAGAAGLWAAAEDRRWRWCGLRRSIIGVLCGVFISALVAGVRFCWRHTLPNNGRKAEDPCRLLVSWRYKYGIWWDPVQGLMTTSQEQVQEIAQGGGLFRIGTPPPSMGP